ncbi:hypothetical protein [Bacillus cereus]|uniref:hypothetical protein n=1 Tax=Bacillus cereus TaxID=1396 RepID=UPI00138E4E77|nr:hypothetical protein [Bacillus cereus]
MRKEIMREFREWGYVVSDDVKDISTAEVLLLTEKELLKEKNAKGFAIVFADEEILKDKYAHCSANQVWELDIEVKAVLISGKISKFYLSNSLGFQFSPMTLLLSPRKINYQQELVSYLIYWLDPDRRIK